MPAVSVKQRRLFAIAEHHPEEVYAKNKGVLGMKKGELHKYASTSEKELPMRTSGNALRDAVMGSSKAVVNVARTKKRGK